MLEQKSKGMRSCLRELYQRRDGSGCPEEAGLCNLEGCSNCSLYCYERHGLSRQDKEKTPGTFTIVLPVMGGVEKLIEELDLILLMDSSRKDS